MTQGSSNLEHRLTGALHVLIQNSVTIVQNWCVFKYPVEIALSILKESKVRLTPPVCKPIMPPFAKRYTDRQGAPAEDAYPRAHCLVLPRFS